MPTLVVTCTPITLPDLPQLNIPNFGIMQKAWEGLDCIPSPMKLLFGFQDNLTIALAPVRRYMEMVELFSAIYACQKAIPDAIMQLSPDPVLDCIPNLVKAVARIIGWIPPYSYFLMAMDVASYIIDVIDEIVDWFIALDARLAQIVTGYEMALSLGDTDLQAILDCGLADLRVQIQIPMSMMPVIKIMANSFMDVFIRLLGLDMLKKVKDIYEEVAEYMEEAQKAVQAAGGSGTITLPDIPGFTPPTPAQAKSYIPIPPMGGILYMLNKMRTGFVMLYNGLAPMAGKDPDKTTREMPTLQYI